MLIVGFGGGVVIEGAPPSVRHIDVIELEPKVIEANQHIAALRRRDPLNDPRVKVILNDARGALRLTDRRYDAIVSQPSHPWTAGASHLYTREFMQLAHDHLNPGRRVRAVDERHLHGRGVCCVRSPPRCSACFRKCACIARTPTPLYSSPATQPLDLEARLAATGLPLRDAPLHYARFGINNTEDLVTALVLDTEGAKPTGRRRAAHHRRRQPHRHFQCLRKGARHDRREHRPRARRDTIRWQRPDSLIYGSLRAQLSFPYMIRRNGIFVLIDASLTDRLGAWRRSSATPPTAITRARSTTA